MASRGKKKTTMAKLTRESRLRERRLDKQARKNARKLAAELGHDPDQSGDTPIGTTDESDRPDVQEPDLEPVVHALATRDPS